MAVVARPEPVPADGEPAATVRADEAQADEVPDRIDEVAGQDPDHHLLMAEIALERRELSTAAREFTAAAAQTTDASVAERATQFNFGAGFDALAERSAERWAELAPNSPVPHEVLGRLKLRRHAVDAAAADFTEALGSSEPRRDEVYLALASDLSSETDARQVTRVFARLTAQDPLAPGVQLALGMAAMRSGDYDLALAAGTAAGLDDPQWPDPQLLVARALAATGHEEEALARIRALAEASPNPLVDLEYARLLADTGKTAEARAQLDGLAAKYGERPEISRTLAFMALAAGELDAADRHFETANVSGQERFENFYYRAQIAARKGDPEGARRLYERISSGPYLVPAQLAIAESFWRGGTPERGVESLVAFGEDHPAQAYDVLEFRAQLLQLMGRREEALAVYGEALEYKPDAIPLLLGRGALLEQLGRIDAALSDLARAAQIAPDDATALNAYGYMLAARTRRTKESWVPVRRALEIEPANPAIQDSVGWALFKLGRREEARSYLEEAFGRLPDPELASHLAETYWTLGDRGDARDLLRSALVAHPDSEPVRSTADRLLK